MCTAVLTYDPSRVSSSNILPSYDAGVVTGTALSPPECLGWLGIVLVTAGFPFLAWLAQPDMRGSAAGVRIVGWNTPGIIEGIRVGCAIGRIDSPTELAWLPEAF